MEYFKEKFSLEKRIEESERILEKYPDRIPVIVEKNIQCNELDDIDRNKYLVPKDLTYGQFIYIIRKRLKISPNQALFIFCDSILYNNNISMNEIYQTSKDDDGYLYMLYTCENTFG